MSSMIRTTRPCAFCLSRLQAARAITNTGSSSTRLARVRNIASSSLGSQKRLSRPLRRYVSTASRLSARHAAPEAQATKKRIDMSEFPPERIRNLSIIAHIDHGKSTLADRLLQMTGTVPASSSPQFLDKLKVERERGITVKAQTVSLIHTHKDGQKYLINLIDTPGHVDFSYEVSRSLGACEGGLLLVDCSQGIQAQTLSVFHHALEAELKLLPVINKVDLPHAYPDETSEEIETSLGLPIEDHMRISAKSGLGVEDVLTNIVEALPPPEKWETDDGKLRGLIFDTFYDQFRGVVSLVRIFSGTLKKGDKVRFLQANRKYEILEVGIHNPDEVPVDELKDGQVGYVVCNMKNSEEAFIGDTICWADKPVEPLPGFKPMKAMVYAGIFPMDSSDFPKLEESIERLTLNDRSVSVQRESSAALSQGFRLGFLGTLHMDVFKQRLEDEYSSEVIVTAPTVPYKVVYLNGTETFISNPVEFPEVANATHRIAHVEEPMINATIFVPNEYIGEMMDLCARYRGIQQEYRILENSDRAILRYQLPLAEIVTDFFSELKSASSGFASFDYEEAGYVQSNLVKLNILINAKPVDALAMIVHKFAAQSIGKAWVKKLKEVVPRQQFELSIQAAVGAKVIARENVSAFRKDVTAGLYGGHYDRKLKHLNKQKEGKKRLKRLAGNIEIPQTAFYQVLSSRPRAFSTSARQHPALASHSSPAVWPSDPVLSRGLSAFLSSSSIASHNGEDPVTQHIPSDVHDSEPLREASVFPPTPIHRHVISPRDRSLKLSALTRMTSMPPPRGTTAAQVTEAYTDAMSSSPDSHVFSVGEVHEIISALRTLQVREGGDKRLADEQLAPLFAELKEMIGDKSQAVKGLELLLLSMGSHTKRRPKTAEIQKAEAEFRKLFPKIPSADDLHARGRYRASINHLMYLCALASHESRFGDWWTKLSRENISYDSYSYLARLILLERAERVEDIPGQLRRMLLDQENAEMTKGDRGVLINFAIAAFARHGRWDVSVPAYAKVLQLEDQADIDTLLPSHIKPEPLIPVPDASENIEVSPHIFGPLLSAYAEQSNFAASLTILKHIFENGVTPSMRDYISLFRGFAIYGRIPDTGAGEMGRVFGVSANAHSGSNEMAFDNASAPEVRPGRSRRESFEERLTEIWERGNMIASPPAVHTTRTENGWTIEALEDVFESFMSITPRARTSSSPSLSTTASVLKAPNKKAVWIILRAFARVSGGDKDMIRRVWEALESKFGEGNAEGWVGWRVDNRLQWAMGILYT
ncbi:GTP-binding protein LepA [Kwoniella heveanensis CBS 569]|nr:GTP-binding protein LepA [Kwoniella heveanensis CBS 569]